MTTRTGLAISGWGAGLVGPATAERRAQRPARVVHGLRGFRVRGGYRSIVAAAAVLAVWALLWAVFAFGVVVPAARFHALAAPPPAVEGTARTVRM